MHVFARCYAVNDLIGMYFIKDEFSPSSKHCKSDKNYRNLLPYLLDVFFRTHSSGGASCICMNFRQLARASGSGDALQG
jgi:hypothetical protein